MNSALHEAVRYLAGRCDGARTLDGSGFNRYDSEFGHSLADRDPERWSPKQARAAWNLLRKYRAQLASVGINYDALPVPPDPAQQAPSAPLAGNVIAFPGNRVPLAAAPWQTPAARRTCQTRGRTFVLRFQYDPALVDRVRALPDRKWDAEGKQWVVFEVSRALAVFLQEEGFEVDAPAQARIAAEVEGADAREAAQEAARAASSAMEADYDVPGLCGPHSLRPYQRAGVRYMVEVADGSLICADEQGIGKTVEGCALIRQLENLGRGGIPALVVCPASAKMVWYRHIKQWLGMTPAMLAGAQPTWMDERAAIVVINYDNLSKHRDWLKARGFRLAIADEGHRLKSPRAQRTQAWTEITEFVPRRMILTGTPVLNRREELIALLKVVGRDKDVGNYRFLRNAPEKKLHEKMRQSCYLRRRKVEVLTDLPPLTRSIVPIPLDNRAEYERAEAEFLKWLYDKVMGDPELRAMEPNERARVAALRVMRAARAEVLVRTSALKQVCARGKLAGAIEWIKQTLADAPEDKMVLFAKHISIQQALIAALPGTAYLIGKDSLDKRQVHIDRFQNDPECRTFVASLDAGSEAITLTAASHCVTLELDWTPARHDQAEARLHRSGAEVHDAINAYYLLADNTIDLAIGELLDEKRTVIQAITDGEDAKTDSLISGLLARLLGGQQDVAVNEF